MTAGHVSGRPLPLEGGGKATRGVGQSLALERGEIGRGFALRDDQGGVRKNLLEMRGERAGAAHRRGGHEVILEETQREPSESRLGRWCVWRSDGRISPS